MIVFHRVPWLRCEVKATERRDGGFNIRLSAGVWDWYDGQAKKHGRPNLAEFIVKDCVYPCLKTKFE